MNYRHAYHAGSFSDVLKHIVLIALLESLKRKDTPFCYIDTHAGIGYYNLYSEMAAKSKEYENGIEKIIQADNPPPLVRLYLDCVHHINNQLEKAKFASLRYYPGSPMIARHFCRPRDRVVACDLHPEEYQALRSAFAGDKQVAVHHLDGFLGLKAFLPPPENRGLVLIDPPYENPEETTRIVHSLPIATKRWANGLYAIWYPIKEKAQIDRFHRSLKANISQPVFVVELTLYPDIPNHLNGCGMAIINPPFQFDHTIKEILPWIWKALTINDQGRFSAYTLA